MIGCLIPIQSMCSMTSGRCQASVRLMSHRISSSCSLVISDWLMMSVWYHCKIVSLWLRKVLALFYELVSLRVRTLTSAQLTRSYFYEIVSLQVRKVLALFYELVSLWVRTLTSAQLTRSFPYEIVSLWVRKGLRYFMSSYPYECAAYELVALRGC